MISNSINRLPRYLFLFLFAIALSVTAASQNPTPADTSASTQQSETKAKPAKKDKASHFILYAGGSLNDLFIDGDQLSSEGAFGWQLGGSYRKNGFFYWQPGLRYAYSPYRLTSNDTLVAFSDSFGVHSLDIPIDVGINLLPFTDRLINVRLFIGAVPSFPLSVTDDNGMIEKSDLNSFNIFARGGVGFDITFLVIDIGYGYGFIDVLANDIQSTPGQAFLNLGFRF